MTIKTRQSIPNILKKAYMIIYGATIICGAFVVAFTLVYNQYGGEGLATVLVISSFTLFTWCIVTYEPYTDVIVDQPASDELLKRKV